jgi:hypothetical protein
VNRGGRRSGWKGRKEWMLWVEKEGWWVVLECVLYYYYSKVWGTSILTVSLIVILIAIGVLGLV